MSVQKQTTSQRTEDLQAEADKVSAQLATVREDEQVLALVVNIPEKAPVEILSSYREGFEKILREHDLSIPLIMLAGQIKVDFKKVPKEWL